MPPRDVDRDGAVLVLSSQASAAAVDRADAQQSIPICLCPWCMALRFEVGRNGDAAWSTFGREGLRRLFILSK